MLGPKRWLWVELGITLVLISACVSPTSTNTTSPLTVVVTATPFPTLSSPTSARTLTVCLVGEPDTLYLYGGSHVPATRHVMEALYDGPIDHVGYAHQPVILEKLPSLADGDAVTRTVNVEEGDRVLDVEGRVVRLKDGVSVLPAGCHVEDCAVEFDGQPLSMEKLYVTFELREGVAWADGEPVTAEDSVFAFTVASDPSTPGRHELAARTDVYRQLGEHVVRWIGLPGDTDPAYFLNFFAPLPRHQLEDLSPPELLQAEQTRRQPLGWGPFVVDDWVTGEYIALSRNPYYFRATEGLPRLDRLEFRFASDVADVTARVLSGECDVGIGQDQADFEPLLPVLVEAEQEGLLRLVSTPGRTWEQIDLGITPVSTYRRPDFFGDARVRQAIAQCIDRPAIVDEVTYGRGQVLDSYLPPDHPLYAGDSLASWEYDPAAAEALLEQVGWLDEDGDGTREASGVSGVPTGTRFEVALLLPSDEEATQQVARIVEANLRDCGIRVTLEELPSWDLFADGPEGPFFGRQFDLVQTTRRLDAVPSCANYVTSEIPDRTTWEGGNVSGYSSPEYDEVCRAARQSLPGTTAYDTHHKEAQIIFSEELPAIPLFVWMRVALARPEVAHLTLDPTAASELWNVESLDFD